MNKFLEKKLQFTKTHKRRNRKYSLLSAKKFNSLETVPKRKLQAKMASLENFIKHLRKKLWQSHTNSSHKREKKETFPTHETSLIFMTKSNRDYTRGKIIPHDHRCKNHILILVS